MSKAPDIELSTLDVPRDRLAARLYRGVLLWTWRRLYFGRVHVIGRLPTQPGTLYLSTHRNGGIDAALADFAAGGLPVPVAASQITRSLWGRWTGCIEVVRATDHERHGHVADGNDPLADALARLAAGESLLWFPEGTSDGGPKLLSIKRGAARLLDAAAKQGIAVRVVVMGIHYQEMDALQSDVDVEVTEPSDLQVAALATIAADGRANEVQHRIETALRAVSIEYPDAASQNDIELLGARSDLPIVDSRRALLRLPQLQVHEWAQRAQAGSGTLPIRATPWLLPWASAAIVWLPALMVAIAATRHASRNNKAFIRSLLAMVLIPFNIVLSSWMLGMLGLRWQMAVPLTMLLLALGLVAHRQLRRARSQTRSMRSLRAEMTTYL
ncbi:MAG TPA: 1-acyl-sn-glycerol-3-phosphate acyltransferase [Xanthomonadaceae bacterium]|nr:1-acyl-sn-glycerol-3-phosphate acyltransferase [Xanthomonadaceae bacterium]